MSKRNRSIPSSMTVLVATNPRSPKEEHDIVAEIAAWVVHTNSKPKSNETSPTKGITAETPFVRRRSDVVMLAVGVGTAFVASPSGDATPLIYEVETIVRWRRISGDSRGGSCT